MVNIRCGASDRIRVPARPTQHVHRRVPHMRRRTRRSASTIGGGTPDMTIGRAAADQEGACPYLHRCAGISLLFWHGGRLITTHRPESPSHSATPELLPSSSPKHEPFIW